MIQVGMALVLFSQLIRWDIVETILLPVDVNLDYR